MLFLLLSLACSGNRFSAPNLRVEHCEPWKDLLEHAESNDSIVGCTERALALIGHDSVAQTTARWNTALQEAGMELLHDDTRAPALEGSSVAIHQSWGNGSPSLALAILSNGDTHTSLVVVP